jgi:hypothetical protein
MGEHEAQTRFLIAALINTQVKTISGEPAGSLYDAISVIDGKIVIDHNVNFGPRDQAKFSIKVRDRIKKMHGNYDEKARIALQANAFGGMVLMFRRWIVPTIKNRWQTRHYNNITDEYEEGYYSTGLRLGKDLAFNPVRKFFMSLVNEAKALEIVSEADWATATEQEKRNIRRLTVDLVLLASTAVLYGLMTGLRDDEPDKDMKLFYNNIAYQLYRLNTDFSFYFNPGSFIKIFQSPLPSSGAIRNASNILEVLTSNPAGKVRTGPWKDHYKIEKNVFSLIPGVRQLYRYDQIDNEFQILKMM